MNKIACANIIKIFFKFSIFATALFNMSCRTVYDEFAKQNYGRVYEQNKLEAEFKNGQCLRSFDNAERWLLSRNSAASKRNNDHNALAWLYVTCPNPAQRNSDKAFILLKTAASIAPLNPAQFDTLACAYALKGDFSQAIQIVRTNNVIDRNPHSSDSREIQFSKKILCLWDGQMPPYEAAVTEDQKRVSETLRSIYLSSVSEAKLHINKKPSDTNAAIAACEKNYEQGNLHFCKSELAKVIAGDFALRSKFDCKIYESDKSKAKRCYEFYFSYVSGRPNPNSCDTEICRQYMCTMHVDLCKK